MSAETVNCWNDDRCSVRDVSCNLKAKLSETAAAWATTPASTFGATANHASKMATALLVNGH